MLDFLEAADSEQADFQLPSPARSRILSLSKGTVACLKEPRLATELEARTAEIEGVMAYAVELEAKTA